VGEEGDKRNSMLRNSKIEDELVKLVTCDIPDSLIESQVPLPAGNALLVLRALWRWGVVDGKWQGLPCLPLSS
jgi:hypothetical protein